MIYTIINYDSWKVHYASARKSSYADLLPPKDLDSEYWFYWRTLCGRDLIGHKVDNETVSCQSCLKAFERGRKTYVQLTERFT